MLTTVFHENYNMLRVVKHSILSSFQLLEKVLLNRELSLFGPARTNMIKIIQRITQIDF